MVKALSDLILPANYVEEHKQGMVDTFNSSLEKVINDNQYRDKPYFISYHDCDDQFRPTLVRAAMKAYDKMPPFMARQIVYWIDNKKGFKEWLWAINDDRKPLFNIEGVQKAKREGAIVAPKHK